MKKILNKYLRAGIVASIIVVVLGLMYFSAPRVFALPIDPGGGGGVSRVVTISASPVSFYVGNSSTLAWSATWADSCTASGSWSGAVAVSGSTSTGVINTPGTYTYSLSCNNSVTGDFGSNSVSITANQLPVPTASLTASPNPVVYGGRATLTWSSTNATSCTAGGPWSNSGTVAGNGLTNPIYSDTTFTFQCTGPGGTSGLQSVIVSAGPAPTVSISASPAAVTTGQSSTLTWSSANTNGCTASGSWSGAKALSGSQSTGALSAGSYNYTLTCSNAAGASQQATATVQSNTPVSGGNLTGFAWSENIGWISFNSISDGSPTTYGVSVDTSTGALSGMAWSENIGWISFNSADVSGCPVAPCSPQVNLSNGTVSGFARALSYNGSNGSWDGWLGLSYSSIVMNLATGAFSGYAWGGGDSALVSGVVGWVNFGPAGGYGGVFGPVIGCINGATNPPACNTCTAPLVYNGSLCTLPTPTASVSVSPHSPPSLPLGSSVTVTWSSSNATSCTASGDWSGAKALSGSELISGLAAGLRTFTISCTGPGGAGVGSDAVTVASFACGNGVCEAGESILSCPVDCKTKLIEF